MAASLTHRGPDGTGLLVDGSVGLAHSRLAIIDIEGGRQPMDSVGGDLTICYNGEIFNHLELRQELEAAGRRFATRCDTEVILEAFALQGPACLEGFNGQWAFALWDRRDQSLLLSRDRVGILPLYYTIVDGSLIFASEVKAILQHPGVSRQIDSQGLDQLFTFWHPIGGRTIFKGIRELPPGHCLRFRDGQAEIWRYWNWDYAPDLKPCRDEEYADQLRALLLDATRLRLRSDVPVGAYLSGGLDSSVVAGLIRRHSSSLLRTFSVTFENAEFDERCYQQEVTSYLETDHSSVECRRTDIGRIFPHVMWHTERPVLRCGPAPLHLLSGLARSSGFKVVLTGEGSDEVLGGYDIFKEAKIRRFWAQQPDSRRRPLLLRKLYPYLKDLRAQPDAYLRAFFHIRPDALASPFFSHAPRWELTAKLKVFFSAALREELRGYDACDEMLGLLPTDFRRWNGLCQSQYLESTGLLPGYILSSQGDRMLMSNSVEGRFPFLDHRVIAFAAKLPPRLKMRGVNEKYVLKRAAGDLIPASVRDRSKQPYRAPDESSFFDAARPQAEPEYVRELLSPERLASDGVFDPSAVGQLVAKARQGRASGVKDNMALVGVLSTQLVIDQFVRNKGSLHASRVR